MDRKQISEHLGEVVAYSKHGQVRPAKIMDDRLWRFTSHSGYRRYTIAPGKVRQTDRSMHETVGYPVLTVMGELPPEERAAAEAWLEEKVISLGDFVTADGILNEGSFFLGIIFKAVLSRDLFLGYREVKCAREAQREAEEAGLRAEYEAWEGFKGDVTEVGRQISELALFDFGDFQPLVPEGFGSNRVRVSLGLVRELLHRAQQADMRCPMCSRVSELKVFRGDGGTEMHVCVKCHEILSAS